jgi:subtilisin family serine protease
MMLRGMGQLRAYEYAIRAGADVVSMSYMWIHVELGNYRGLFRTAHEHMAACGLVAVGGAGNFRRSAPPGRQIALPKDIPCVIAAAGILEDGRQSPLSSEGPCTWDDVRFYGDYPKDAPLVKPDVTACFRDFPLWHRTQMTGREVQVVWQGPDGYGLITGPGGNSFAGPHAAGVAALMLSVQPELTPWRVQELMCATCEDLGEPGKDVKFGAGLLRADAAVEAARNAKVE